MPIDNASPSNVHGVIENRTDEEAGLCVLYSVGETHFRVRVRPVAPARDRRQTFEEGDAWTAYAFEEVETPEEDAPAVETFDLTHVPRVVREQVPGVVQVPSPDADDESVRNAVEDAER